MRGAVLVVVGLATEARTVAGPGMRVVAGGGSRSGLEHQLAGIDPRDLRAVLSFGLAGALHPGLRVGDLLSPDSVVSVNGDPIRVNEALAAALGRAVAADGIAARNGGLAGSDVPLLTTDAKAELRGRVSAVAVDMESHIAGRYAEEHDVPFAAVRVISDPADRSLPEVAGRAMRPDGSVDLRAVLSGLARDPRQLPSLIRTARDAAVAFRQLRRVGGLLRRRAGLVDLGGSLLGLGGGLLGLGGRLLGLEL